MARTGSRRARNRSVRKVIPYSKQTIDPSDIRAVAKALKDPFLTQGPAVTVFGERIAKYVGARYCVVFSSGTAALHGAYFAAGIGAGDEVIVPALTFAATANAALYLGAKPVFADVLPDSGNIDPCTIEALITPKTKAIVPVDYAGNPADIAAIRSLTKKHKLIFIEDAAQAFGATYKKKKVGTQADMTMFSFHPVKTITTGEGGAITTNSKTFYEKLMMFRTHGLTRDTRRLREKKYAAWHQEMHFLGYNYRLPDILAALGSSQLKRTDSHVKARRTLAKRYFDLLKDESDLLLPPLDSLPSSAWHLFVVRLVPQKAHLRDKVFYEMRKVGIWVQVHYLPVHHHPHYQDLGHKKGSCPIAERFSFSGLSIPLYPHLSKKDQDYVVKTLHSILTRI